MARFVLLATALVAISACKKDSKSEGLPPAQEWSASGGQMQPAPQPTQANPHAGMNMGGADPHAGIDMGGANPHAGVDMTNPHGAGGPDVTQMGLSAPDPNRKIDPTHRIAGMVKVHPKAEARLSPGGAVFLIVKRAGADGAPSGPPIAVDKLTWAKDGVKFEVTEANAMIAGTEMTGQVVVTARFDQDGDAMSKQPGDVTGSSRVTVPADNVTILLDDVMN